MESEVWNEAQRHIKGLGSLSALFTSTIRALNLNEEENRLTGKKGFGDQTRHHLGRLLGSPTVVAHLYFFASSFFAPRLQGKSSLTPLEFSELFEPSELASVLSVAYLYRTLKRKMKDDQWEILSLPMRRAVDLGIELGTAIPAIGVTRGLLAGALRYLAWGMFISSNAEKMKKYRVNLRIKKQVASLEMELADWDTSHAHVGSMLLQSLGFGINFASDYMNGLVKPIESLNASEQCFRVAQVWIDSLLSTGAPPEDALGDNYVLKEDGFEPFVQSVKSILDAEAYDRWLEKSRSDLSAEKTPLLNYNYELLSKTFRSRGGDVEGELSE